jgi:hypothetical protein
MWTATGNASPVCIDNNTLDQYIALGAGGCTIGDKLFSNFGYSASAVNTGAPAASQISVVGIPGPGGGVINPGIQFSSGSWLVFANQTIDATITYTVSAPSGFLIEDADLTMAGRVQSGTGVGSVTESLFNGGPIPGSPLVTNIAGAGNAHLDFVGAGGSDVSTLNISTAVHVQANVPGRVTISSITENFSELQSVPEPVETLLIGSGFLMLGLLWRERIAR